LSKVDAILQRVQAQSGIAPAQSASLLRVSWDASPDLVPFLAFVTAFARGRFSATLAERVTLASAELLDNAVRYGSLAREFTYELHTEGGQVSVSVQNNTVQARVDMLTSQLRRLDAGADQVYASELERSLSPGSGRRSMLGLARIRHEAEMRIELSVNGNWVKVRAYCAR
jgi:hypothetical protein